MACMALYEATGLSTKLEDNMNIFRVVIFWLICGVIVNWLTGDINIASIGVIIGVVGSLIVLAFAGKEAENG